MADGDCIDLQRQMSNAENGGRAEIGYSCIQCMEVEDNNYRCLICGTEDEEACYGES